MIPNDKGWDDMNFFVVKIICDDGSLFPNKENHIPF
jgi:hypothetical protein